ncbi:MAG TPA: M24 family metallopeptidase [Kofleriaceae bacterium]|nr:M24 family metallopeptidase [Kofleriaceae bacterium]
MSTEMYSPDELEQVRALQKLAYDCAEAVATELSPGVTERQAAARLGALLRERGVDGFFHTPFAWFGDRSGFYGFRSPSWRRPQDNLYFSRQFFPTERRLEEGMIGILDVAPIKGGLCADIGYTFAHGDSLALTRAINDLGIIRDLVLDEVRAERTMKQVYQAVDAAIEEMGYESAHALYPSRVLGHKIGRIPLRGAAPRVLAGFDLRTYLYFGKQILMALPGVGRVPLWNQARLADVRPDPGLWAIEPHVRKHGIGAKWEEILVVTDSDAVWLDDDLPHVRARRSNSIAGNATVH